MGSEIERKYLVDVGRWTPRGPGVLYRQGYLSSHKERVVRVRLHGSTAKLTIKGATQGVTRAEYEYDLPFADAIELLALCERPLIEKTRHVEDHGGMTWEIDVFHGDNEGLVMAEVELSSESQAIEIPVWATREVSDDSRYYNSNLIAHPYRTWMKDP
jgi:adenylate cyclase